MTNPLTLIKPQDTNTRAFLADNRSSRESNPVSSKRKSSAQPPSHNGRSKESQRWQQPIKIPGSFPAHIHADLADLYAGWSKKFVSYLSTCILSSAALIWGQVVIKIILIRLPYLLLLVFLFIPRKMEANRHDADLKMINDNLRPLRNSLLSRPPQLQRRDEPPCGRAVASVTSIRKQLA